MWIAIKSAYLETGEKIVYHKTIDQMKELEKIIVVKKNGRVRQLLFKNDYSGLKLEESRILD